MDKTSAQPEGSELGDSLLLIILSGPSGVGKDAVLSRMRERGSKVHFTVTATTRAMRPKEQDGIDYIFLTREEFTGLQVTDGLLEDAEVFGNYYGVPKSQVTDALARGQDVILKIDVQGASTVRSLCPEALFIFLAPPDRDELTRRLRERNTESDEAFELRLRTASAELEKAQQFDYVVVNHTNGLDQAVIEIEEIIDREKHRVPPRRINLD